MTTIAYKDGFIAADSQIGDERGAWAHVDKIHPARNGWVVAGAGRLHTLRAVFDFVDDLAVDADPDAVEWPAAPEDDSATEALVVIPGVGLWHWQYAPHVVRLDVLSPGSGIAIGTGQLAAMAAMAAGADEGRAVEIARDLDPHTGGPIHVIRVADLRREVR